VANQENPREIRRRQNDFRAELTRRGWYHSFELPDGGVIEGVMSLAWQRARWARFPIPSVLSGKRVLDIGPWDGWFSFEAERRGAEVTSVDCYEVPNYHYLHRRLGSKAVHRILNLYELPAAGLARVELLAVDSVNVSVACYRKWEPEPAEPRIGPPELLRVANATTGGVNFYPVRDEYIACWFRSAAESVTREDLAREDLHLE